MQMLEKLKTVFNFTDEEFLSHNENSTLHVQSYFKGSMDGRFRTNYEYLNDLRDDLPEYCEFGADKCRVSNFRDFCDSLDVDIADNLARMLKKYYHMFENKIDDIIERPRSFIQQIRPTLYHFCNRDRTFTFTCSSPLYMEGSLGYFGCTGLQKYVIEAFEMIHKDGNYDLCYGGRDYA
jgi:hypothetical protein